MTLILMILFFSLTISMIFISTPLYINLILIKQIIIVSLIMGMNNSNFWFSYILFLIFIGGLMILFLYVTSLINNKLSKFNTKKMMMTLMILFFMLFMSILFIYPQKTFNLMDSNEIYSNLLFLMNNLFNNFLFNENYYLCKIYNSYSSVITLMLMNYLLLTMIICIKIINFSYGPLRIKSHNN